MTTEKRLPRALSRRDLLKMAAAGLLAGCGRQLPAALTLSEHEEPTG